MRRQWPERTTLLVVSFWLAALADGLSTYAAVFPYGANLEHEVNPFLKGASWTRFSLLLVIFHLVIQLWFHFTWPKRQVIKSMAAKGVGYLQFSLIAAKRFLTIHIPDEIQVVYTGLTMYAAVVVAHILAVLNNTCVALRLPSGFSLLARFIALLVPQFSSDEIHSASIVVFYVLVIFAGVALSHVWFVWFLREDEEQTISEIIFNRIPEKAYRFCGFFLFLGCVCHKWTIRHTYSNQFLWLLETVIFLSLAIFYLIREPARSLPVGFSETVIPVVGGFWPFLLLFTDRGAFGLRHQSELLVLMSLGTAIALWGYAYLNKAFTIMVEARVLKRGGPYRFVRHPVYSGQLLTALAVLCWRFSWLNFLLVLFFTAIQWYRAKMEEQKLANAFSEYAEYAKKTGMFLPRLGKWS